MVTSSKPAGCSTDDLGSDATWSALYPSLYTLAQRLVYSLRVCSWRRQEDDIVEDIVQETIRRVLERSRKAENGEATPIHSVKAMMIVIARNYCQDLRRSDRRLVHLLSDEELSEVYTSIDDLIPLAELATENAYQELVFRRLASEIVKFPEKQRRALFVDLANRMHFDDQPTPLQAAFLAVGIRLEEYQLLLPSSRAERARQASLLNLAYKRVAQLSCVQQYLSIA
jgi:DNA-directed RNA polymerase specialized sigma24 family protein